MFEDTIIVHDGSALTKGAKDTCAYKFVQHKTANMFNRGMKIEIYSVPKNHTQETLWRSTPGW